MNKDLANKVKPSAALRAQAFTTTGIKVGLIIDTLGFESGMFEIFVGTFATGTLDFTEIQESDASDMSGETAIPADRLIGSVAQLAAADTVEKIGYVASKRYVRLTVTTAGTVSFVAGANSILGDAHVEPTD